MSENSEQSHEGSYKLEFNTLLFQSDLDTDRELFTEKNDYDDENNQKFVILDINNNCENKSESINLTHTFRDFSGFHETNQISSKSIQKVEANIIRNKKTKLNSHTSYTNEGRFTGKLLSSLSSKKIYNNKILGIEFIKISEQNRKSIFTDFCNYLVYLKLNKSLTDLEYIGKFDMLSYKIVKQNVDVKSMNIFFKKKLNKIYDYEKVDSQNNKLMHELDVELQAIIILSNLNDQTAEALEKGILKNMKLIQEMIHYSKAEKLLVMLKTEVKHFFNEFKNYVSRESEPEIKMAFDRKKKEELADYKKRYLESLNRFLLYYNVLSSQPNL
jgi:hypothetical protein